MALPSSRTVIVGILISVTASCASNPGPSAFPVSDTVRVVDTVVVSRGNAEDLRAQVAGLQLQVLEREAQLEDLLGQLDQARREAVRAMARLQSLATRAEAASAIAEAEVALRRLQDSPGVNNVSYAEQLLAQSNAAFDDQNHGGALYLANEAKKMASPLGRDAGGAERQPGEVSFAAPIRLQTLRRSNVREGPGTKFPVVVTLDTGAPLVAYSYVDEWIRVTLGGDRDGWIFRSLVGSGR